MQLYDHDPFYCLRECQIIDKCAYSFFFVLLGCFLCNQMSLMTGMPVVDGALDHSDKKRSDSFLSGQTSYYKEDLVQEESPEGIFFSSNQNQKH